MRSQYKGIKFDLQSATPLIEAFTKYSVTIDQPALQKLLTSQPDLQAVMDFATAAVSSMTGLDDGAKIELKRIIDGLKGKETGGNGQEEEERGIKLRDSNVFIEDIHQFKAGLKSSKAPIPLEPLGPTAKL